MEGRGPGSADSQRKMNADNETQQVQTYRHGVMLRRFTHNHPTLNNKNIRLMLRGFTRSLTLNNEDVSLMFRGFTPRQRAIYHYNAYEEDDVIEALLNIQAGSHMESNLLIIKWIETTLVSGEPSLVEDVCELSDVVVDNVLEAIWENHKFELLQVCFPGNPSSLLSLSSEIVHNLLILSFQDDNPEECLENLISLSEWRVLIRNIAKLCKDRSLMILKNGMNLADYILMKIPNGAFKFLLCTESLDIMNMLVWSSNKEVVLGKSLLRTVVSNCHRIIVQTFEACCHFHPVDLYGVLDLDFMLPLLTGRMPVRTQAADFAGDSRDLIILLVRSGLLHQFRSWLMNQQFPKCHGRGCYDCESCGAGFIFRHDTATQDHVIGKLLLESGFLPNKLLFQLRESCLCPERVGPQYVAMLDGLTTSPYSLVTLCTVQISTSIGCHCGRKERIQQLPLPEMLKKRVAFEDPDHKLSSELRQEEQLMEEEEQYKEHERGGDEEWMYDEEEEDDDEDEEEEEGDKEEQEEEEN